MSLPLLGARSSAGLADIFMDSRPQTDADALAYIAAASLTDPTHLQAAHALVGGLKALGLWSKMVGLYPFIGGSAASHAVNAKSPGTFTITGPTWSSGVTHNSNGVTGDGSTGYGDTGINPVSVGLGVNSTHLSIYNRSSFYSDKYEVGAYSSNTSALVMYPNFSTTNGSVFWSGGEGVLAVEKRQTKGFLLGSRVSASLMYILNPPASPSVNNTSTSGHSLPSRNVLILALNLIGNPNRFTNKNLSFFSIGSGLTISEAVAFSTLVQHVQGVLGRAV